MADLAPAFIGLGGVVIGAGVAQVADHLRRRQERRERLQDRQREVLIHVLKSGMAIVGNASAIIDTVASGSSRASLTVDFSELDRAVVAAGQYVDELRVLGPEALVEPAADFFADLADFREAAVRLVAPDELKPLTERLYALKQTLIDAAADAGLIEQ